MHRGLAIVLLVTAVWTSACRQQERSSSTNTTAVAPGAPRVDAATAGRIEGTVRFEGTAPQPRRINMGADPYCVSANSDPRFPEEYAVGENGALQNAFVYIKEGLGVFVYDSPTEPVVLDQARCRYEPHVFGVRVGQPVAIVNSDATLHNIHFEPAINREFNLGQPTQGMRTLQTFTAREVMMPVSCDVHRWMNAYVGVLDHPFFAVTDAAGRFEMRSVPPGSYVIEVWHERLGTKTTPVTVEKQGSAAATLTYVMP